MDSPRSFIVIALQGTALRKEPTLHSETEDGNENVLLSLPENTIVTQESDEVRDEDGHQWFRVRAASDSEGIVGWVESDSLEELEFNLPEMPLTQADLMSIYLVTFDDIQRVITETNLKTALEKKKLSKIQLTDSQIEVNLNRPFQDVQQYWATRDNLDNITFEPQES